jgi:hypothetical protein
MKSNEEPIEESTASPVDSFLAQPAYSAEEDSEQAAPEPVPTSNGDVRVWTRFGNWFNHFMFEKEPSQYSSIAPRSPDGTRSKIFFFNGSGRGR